MLVAVFMLFVVGAMAALSIDVVTLYTARSEAQLAADAGALAGARVLANSGMTSEASLTANAEATAKTVAKQVAANNYVGGSQLKNSDVTVTINDNTPSNPHVTVQIQVNTLPTFFARIWGNKTLTVAAAATAEAYNPSGNNISVGRPPGRPHLRKTVAVAEFGSYQNPGSGRSNLRVGRLLLATLPWLVKLGRMLAGHQC